MTVDLGQARWVPDAATFGARLALVRQKMGWNLKEAALACGLPSGSWREWELHGREPRGLNAIATKIADRTGCDDYWLMTGRPSPGGSGDGTAQPVGELAEAA